MGIQVMMRKGNELKASKDQNLQKSTWTSTAGKIFFTLCTILK